MNITLAILPLLLTLGLIGLFKKPALHWKLFDSPGGRKQHIGCIPLTGGIAIFISFFVTCLVASTLTMPLTLGLAVTLMMGILDDRFNLPAKPRLFAQVTIALVVFSRSDMFITDLGQIFGGSESVELGLLSLPFTLLCSVGLINAINMSDGIDGLASGLVVTALVSLAAADLLAGVTPSLTLGILVFATAGFMIVNAPHPFRRTALVFLGDSGSMVLGLALAYFAVQHGQGASRTLSPIAVAWVVALPVVDTIRVMTTRMLSGKSPLAPDRGHLHHVLMNTGLSPAQTTWLIISLSGMLGLIGVVSLHFNVPDSWLGLGFLGLLPCEWLFVRYTQKWQITKPTLEPLPTLVDIDPVPMSMVSREGVMLNMSHRAE